MLCPHCEHRQQFKYTVIPQSAPSCKTKPTAGCRKHDLLMGNRVQVYSGKLFIIPRPVYFATAV